MDLSKDAEIDQLIASKKAEKEKRKKEQSEQGSVPEQPPSKKPAISAASGSGGQASSSASTGKAVVSTSPSHSTPVHSTPLPRQYIFDGEHCKKILAMGVPALKALSTALNIDVDGLSKPDIIAKVIRLEGTVKKIVKFDVDANDYEFEKPEILNFQQPATIAPPS